MAAKGSESEVIAQGLQSLGQQIDAFETRLTEVERIIRDLEAAALTTARAMEEVSRHWDSVYRAMRRAE
jgi:prefoldin subunit 5